MDGCPTSDWNACVGSAIFSPLRGDSTRLEETRRRAICSVARFQVAHAEAGSAQLSRPGVLVLCGWAWLVLGEDIVKPKEMTVRAKGEKPERADRFGPRLKSMPQERSSQGLSRAVISPP